MLNVYDEYETIGDDARIGDNETIGDNSRIGDWVTIGHSVGIGDYVTIGDNARIGDGVRIGHSVTIGDNARIGDGARIGNYGTIGHYGTTGERVEVGYGATIGEYVKIGDKFRCEGMKVIDFFTMANVDGTGRRIHIYIHTDGIAVRAGCFEGTLDEFCEKAKKEEKYLYSVTVRAAAEAFAAEVRRQGKTGGWDK